MALTREGNKFFLGEVGAPKDQLIELYPESATKFFAKTMPMQVSIVMDPQGKVTGLVQSTSGFENRSPRVGESEVKTGLAKLAERIKNKTPESGSDKALRRYIEGLQRGQPNYDELALPVVLLTQEQLPKYVADFKRWGAMKSLTFVGVGQFGEDKYLAVFENARVEMFVEPLSTVSKTGYIGIHEIEK